MMLSQGFQTNIAQHIELLQLGLPRSHNDSVLLVYDQNLSLDLYNHTKNTVSALQQAYQDTLSSLPMSSFILLIANISA